MNLDNRSLLVLWLNVATFGTLCSFEVWILQYMEPITERRQVKMRNGSKTTNAGFKRFLMERNMLNFLQSFLWNFEPYSKLSSFGRHFSTKANRWENSFEIHALISQFSSQFFLQHFLVIIFSKVSEIFFFFMKSFSYHFSFSLSFFHSITFFHFL